MDINYREEFSETIKNLGADYTSGYCFKSLVYAVENVCSLTDLERILEGYKTQIGE